MEKKTLKDKVIDLNRIYQHPERYKEEKSLNPKEVIKCPGSKEIREVIYPYGW